MKKQIPLLIFVFLYTSFTFAQTETIPVENTAVQDTVVEESPKKKKHKRVSDFKVYGGISARKYCYQTALMNQPMPLDTYWDFPTGRGALAIGRSG